jgi:PleD family two-component response regulator
MTSSRSLSGQSILIVDGQSLSAADISNRLVALGAKVHVVPNAASAMAMARAKRLDVALIGYRPEECSGDLKRTLDQYGVPYIMCASAVKQDHLDYQKVFSLALEPAVAA